MKNLILIGMPGAGKSTVGVLVAKALGYSFIDTDLIIQDTEGELLQDIIDERGIEYFLKVEEKVLSNLTVDKAVIATGGSAIYSDKGIAHLKSLGKLVYLQLPFEVIEKRINNITTRGVAMKEGQDLRKLYKERCPLYELYADVTINGERGSVEEVVEEVIRCWMNI